MAGECGVLYVCLKAPTSDPNKQVGQTFTMQASWVQKGPPLHAECEDFLGESTPQYSTDNINFSDIGAATPLSCPTSFPEGDAACGQDMACSACAAYHTWTITCNTAGTYYIRVKTTDYEIGLTKYSSSQVVTVTAAGWGNKIYGIANASIGKIYGIAKSAISKVYGK